MKSYSCLVSLILIYYVFDLDLISSLTYLDNCLTPHKKDGKCVLVKECPVIKEIVSRNTLSPGDINYLEKSKCGTAISHKAFVCCPLENTKLDTVTENLKEQVESITRSPEFLETTVTADDTTLDNELATEAMKKETTTAETLLLLPTTCGYQDENQIVGGEITSLTDFPWLALLQMQKKNGKEKFFCGGALISEKYILTAANCIESAAKEMGKITSVRLGEWDLSNESDCTDDICSDSVVDIQVDKIIQHENYQSSGKNLLKDIALIRLAKNVNFTEFIRPICLPQQNVDEYSSKFTVAGWGTLNGRTKNERKRFASLTLVGKKECQTMYSQTNLTDYQICAVLDAGKEKCYGDTGGPLMAIVKTTKGSQYYMAGINSFGIGCFVDGEPDIYTSVDSYLNWINANLEL